MKICIKDRFKLEKIFKSNKPKTKKIINQVFGVYLNKMGLEYPGGPGYITKPSLYQKIKYEIFHLLRVIYWRYLKKK